MIDGVGRAGLAVSSLSAPNEHGTMMHQISWFLQFIYNSMALHFTFPERPNIHPGLRPVWAKKGLKSDKLGLVASK